MNITWNIDLKDVETTKAIIDAYRDHPMVRDRLVRNLADDKPAVSRAQFWRAIVGALLTTQQRSGPESAVARFMNPRLFPLTYDASCKQRTPKRFFRNTLSSFGGIRRHGRIADELVANLHKLEDGLWSVVVQRLDQLRASPTRASEIAVADFIDDELAGIGPKQARNLLQDLGLTRYEIPIDSRITKWLNRIGFPVHLSGAGLGDRDYYKFVMEGIFQLCKASEVYPCVLDAAVFSSFGGDGDGWTDENVGW
jgi:hypothetical protein